MGYWFLILIWFGWVVESEVCICELELVYSGEDIYMYILCNIVILVFIKFLLMEKFCINVWIILLGIK